MRKTKHVAELLVVKENQAQSYYTRAGQLVIDFDGDAKGDTLYPKNQCWTSHFVFGSCLVPHRPFFTYVVNFASYGQFFWENPCGQWGDGHRAMIFGGQIGYPKIPTFSFLIITLVKAPLLPFRPYTQLGSKNADRCGPHWLIKTMGYTLGFILANFQPNFPKPYVVNLKKIKLRCNNMTSPPNYDFKLQCFVSSRLT